jgi:uncharacterized protein involved in response to NO
MAKTSAEQMRAWQGPALFSFGFRPFFLFGAFWVALAMLLWLPAVSGALSLPTRFDPVSWHAHEFLFGYLGAVLAGFLLTAVPNWTGRLPMVGWPLAALFALWVAGRVAVLISVRLPVADAPVIDLAFPLVLGSLILREIVAGRNWRNLIVFGGLHLVRQARWQPHHTLREPLVWVLHAAYLFIPLGAFALGLDQILGNPGTVGAQHLWMAGAIGAMTTAVMTRASLGHTGQPLTANRATVAVYLCLFGSVLARYLGTFQLGLTHFPGVLWLAAFAGFVFA